MDRPLRATSGAFQACQDVEGTFREEFEIGWVIFVVDNRQHGTDHRDSDPFPPHFYRKGHYLFRVLLVHTPLRLMGKSKKAISVDLLALLIHSQSIPMGLFLLEYV